MDIRDRSFDFSVQIVQFCHALPAATGVLPHLSLSLMQSACAIGLHVEEAHGSGKTDFISKMQAAASSAREAHYWLRLLAQAQLLSHNSALEPLQDEAQQLAAILSSIVKTAKRNENSH